MKLLTLTELQKKVLYANTRPDEVFFVQDNKPKMKAWGVDWFFRRVSWDCGFRTYIMLWLVRWYRTQAGGSKCDGSRTSDWNARWNGYVMTQTKKEALSVRFRFKKPDRERWNNMGGI